MGRVAAFLIQSSAQITFCVLSVFTWVSSHCLKHAGRWSGGIKLPVGVYECVNVCVVTFDGLASHPG